MLLADTLDELGNRNIQQYSPCVTLPCEESAWKTQVIYGRNIDAFHVEFRALTAWLTREFNTRLARESDTTCRRGGFEHIYFASLTDLFDAFNSSLSTRRNIRVRTASTRKSSYKTIILAAPTLQIDNPSDEYGTSKCILLRGKLFDVENASVERIEPATCIHLPAITWFEGDWTESFEICHSTEWHLCSHWPPWCAETPQTASSVRIEWTESKKKRTRNSGSSTGCIRVALCTTILRGRKAQALLDQLDELNKNG